jgi:branched-chain amino acid transport system substrate-binding protein
MASCTRVSAIGCLLALGAMGTEPSWAQPLPDITVGVIAEVTGAGATYGQGILHGAEMAVRDINAGGGIGGRRMKLIVADGGSNPARSAIAMRHLVAANVDVVVGGWGSPQVRVNMDIAEQSGTPYVVVGATHPKITSPRNHWTFRVIQTDAVMAEHLARVVVERLRARRIAVLYDSNDYGTGNREVFLDALGRLGVEPVEVQSFQTSDTAFDTQLQRLQAIQPDVIAVFGTLPAAPAIMRKARERGLRGRFVGTGGLANEGLIEDAAGAAEGTVLMTHFSEEADEQSQAWAKRYRVELAGGTQPPRPILAAWEYRAIRGIVAPCMETSGTDRARLRDCLRRWRGQLFGVKGEAHFDESGQLIQPPVVVEVRGGTFRLLGSAR